MRMTRLALYSAALSALAVKSGSASPEAEAARAPHPQVPGRPHGPVSDPDGAEGEPPPRGDSADHPPAQREGREPSGSSFSSRVLPTSTATSSSTAPSSSSSASLSEDARSSSSSSTTPGGVPQSAARRHPDWAHIVDFEHHQEWLAQTGWPGILTHEACWELAKKGRAAATPLSNPTSSRSSPSPTTPVAPHREDGAAAAVDAAAADAYPAAPARAHYLSRSAAFLSEAERRELEAESAQHREAERLRQKNRASGKRRAAFADLRTSISVGQERVHYQGFQDLGRSCEQYSGMLPAAAKLSYLDRMKMARGIILSELLAKNRLIKRHAKEQAKGDPGLQLSRRRLEELRAGRRGGEDVEEERRLAQLLQQEEEEFLQDRGRPFLNVRLRQEVVQAQAEARRRQRLERLHQKWQDDKDYFIKGGRRIVDEEESTRRKRERKERREQKEKTKSRTTGTGSEQADATPSGAPSTVVAGVDLTETAHGNPSRTFASLGEVVTQTWTALGDLADTVSRTITEKFVDAPPPGSPAPEEQNLTGGAGTKGADVTSSTSSAAPASVLGLPSSSSASASSFDWNIDLTELFSNEENADGFFVPPDLASQLKRAPKIPDVAKAVEERRNRCTTRSSSTSSTNDADVAGLENNRRCLQSGDIRIIGVTTSMANQTLVKRIQGATVVYDLNQVPVLNRIPIPELLKDDNSYSNDPQLQAADNPYLTMFTLYNFQSRTALVMHQRRGSIFVYDVDSGTGDDIPRGVDFNEVLPPIMRFRFHSCKENDAFCHLQTSTYIDDGVVVLDRHRMQILEYKWRFFEGVDRVYDRDVESMILRVPQHSLFGQLDVAGGGKTGLKSAEAILKYQTVSSTIFALPSDDGFTDGHNITNPDFLFADNTFLIVADTGNDRLVLFNMTSTLSYVYYDEFKMAQSLKPVPEFRRPVALAMFLPGLEYRESPTYANVFVCDRLNHRILKLDFGYYQYSEPYNFTIYDEFGLIDRIETRHRLYRLWDGPGPHLEYDSQLGDENAYGSFSQGLLTEPVSVQTHRHYIFVLQYSSDEIGAFTLNYNNTGLISATALNGTREFLFVTKFTSPRKIEYGIGVSYNGYVWFAQQEDRAASFEKDIAVFELPRDLRESTYQYKIADLRSQCVDLDDFNTTLMADPSEFVRVVSNALNLSGLQYFYPNRSGSYIDLHLFNLTKVSDPSSGLSVALDQSVTPVTPILLDPTEKAGFHFDLWNAVIYHGLMEFCEVFIPTPPPMLFGGTSGWTAADGSALQQWDISSAADLHLFGLVLRKGRGGGGPFGGPLAVFVFGAAILTLHLVLASS